ncbi:MAG: hypothetical protein EBY22_08545 [Gammaproteobacteria bacterium]|nr:hypothetical protein [Gammaproteobacteria bacterium]
MSYSEDEQVFFIEPLQFIHPAVKKLHARGAGLLNSINEDIQQLNDLITEYNRANNLTDRIAKLKQLEATRQRLDDVYGDDQISFFSFYFSPDYQSSVYTALHQSLYQQRTRLRLESVGQMSTTLESDSGQELSDVLDEMSMDDIVQIMQILASGASNGIHQQLTKIAPQNLAYQNFLIQHDVECIGGGNSKNFAFTHRLRQQRTLLKLENRLNTPKKNEREFRALMSEKENEPSFLVREWSDRRAVFIDPRTNLSTIRRLTVMDYNEGSSLSDLPVEADIAAQQNLAIDVALAQIMIYKKMHLLGRTWTDGKGDNLLLHRDPITQCMVAEIADCKAIYTFNPETGTAEFEEPICRSIGRSAPELLVETPDIIDVDKAAVYTVGKNLFESLLCFVPEAYQKYVTPVNKKGVAAYQRVELLDQSFNHPIFDVPFKALIQDTTRAYPAARISNDELFLKLLDIKYTQHPESAQYQQIGQKLKQIIEFDLPSEEKQQRKEFVFKCYQFLLIPEQDLNKLDQRLNRVIQKYEERTASSIYKEALSSQKKAGVDENKGQNLEIK